MDKNRDFPMLEIEPSTKKKPVKFSDSMAEIARKERLKMCEKLGARIKPKRRVEEKPQPFAVIEERANKSKQEFQRAMEAHNKANQIDDLLQQEESKQQSQPKKK